MIFAMLVMIIIGMVIMPVILVITMNMKINGHVHSDNE